ncbi:hypothetical protein GCM10017744_021610 [Streptomyces antimycoticus]|uniref:Uncharacterized protein n=1 Tax=Streptomyces antimycoticus TaxID=68175 RepID=A0A4D4KDW7_9ACTN|nr:hypothetical protein [Streptomyces antimycoticus]BBJ39358.1 hypothetical protein SSPO_020760 [Streptomyces antimycoticus]GDY47155.1 hypothetical protein SANT12839_080370 [Streptomyces antimycoticus]
MVTATFRRQTGADEDDPDWPRWIERCLTLDTVPDIGDLRRDLCRLSRKPRRP